MSSPAVLPAVSEFLAKPRRMLIGSEWKEASGGEWIETPDPATGKTIGRFPAGGAADVDAAVAIENASPYGNAAAVYTRNGGVARYVSQRASAGMIGVNVGVPVPLEPFGFGGWNESRFGVCDITGKSSLEFWTQAKKVTARWN